jgi:hypothetical protein
MPRVAFLANLGYDRESNFAFLYVEDCVSRVPLREDYLFPGKAHDFPTLAYWWRETFLGSKSCLLLADLVAAPKAFSGMELHS